MPPDPSENITIFSYTISIIFIFFSLIVEKHLICYNSQTHGFLGPLIMPGSQNYAQTQSDTEEATLLTLKEDKNQYKKLLMIAIPMMIQNGISNFVNLLDNLMIGDLGTNAISGVAIANQLIFVFYLLIFGATAGVGIFTAQYHGKGDTEGIRYTFRFKIVLNTILSALSILAFLIAAPFLVELFLHGKGDPADAAEILDIGVDYIHVILISLIPIGLTQAYAGTLKDLGKTKVPMLASLCAIVVNLIGNALLIYGKLGLPALGAVGAAARVRSCKAGRRLCGRARGLRRECADMGGLARRHDQLRAGGSSEDERGAFECGARLLLSLQARGRDWRSGVFRRLRLCA